MSKISLCLIAGNVEEYIDRCLASFAPIADEIVVVRAIGSQNPDRTLAIAENKFGARVAEYRNAPEHSDWPHIDNFAAARQMSFDLATGDYCFWCDTDDVLESGANLVRELAERGGYAAFVFPYRIFAKGFSVPRERMIAKRAGKWRYPVHECFEFAIQPAQAIEDQRVVVKHLPHLSKTGSSERNLRILRAIPEKEMTTGLRYHLHCELSISGDVEGSIEAARKVLQAPDLGRAEKYELFLNLAQLSKEPAQKEAFLHQAYAADPTRREALGLLAANALNMMRDEDALAYARQMVSTQRGQRIEWNDRAAVYGWVGDDIFAQALRANGNIIDAERVRLTALQNAGGARIGLVHATRGRPEKAALTRKLWLDLAERPDQIEHIFVFDADDEASHCLRRMHHLEISPGGGCVAAWNNGAISTAAPIVVQLSDDWIPPMRWDELIVERFLRDCACRLEELPARVLAISDGLRNDQLLCMAICTRKYLDLDHFLFHPWFSGVYSDNWFTELAYKRNLVIEARDLIFTHEHPLRNGETETIRHSMSHPPEWDETYARQNAPARYAEGQAMLEYLRVGNDWSSIPGFFNYWAFYGSVARILRDGDTVCEIGIWLGRSIIFLAQLLKRQGKRVKLIAVDTFAGELNQPAHAATVAAHGGNLRAAFDANLKRCGVEDMIRVIQGDSAESADFVADGSLSFCYIDAAHDYESVKRDIAAWREKVRRGGILAGHDAHHEPVSRAVYEAFPDAARNGSVWFTKV